MGESGRSHEAVNGSTGSRWTGFLLRLVGARTAGFELAKVALEDEPMRPRAAHAAIPQEQTRIGLDDVERVTTM